jgi:DNA-binding NtrC family response regulator
MAIAPELISQLESYDWPGNVRELANVIEREVSLADESVKILERLEVPLSPVPMSARRDIQGRAPSAADVIPLAEVERRVILDALTAFGGNVSRAARALGISRATYYVKLKEWGVPVSDAAPESRRRSRAARDGS